ncbi:hypothetical protein SBRCBS47491_001721 [Sporothrix bragantina]|uniref:2EXR domain-containing protein n=1 Tax=Sporothrix bragantina TaxID=671064 RepID=A0ABP0B1D9_9PEZI
MDHHSSEGEDSDDMNELPFEEFAEEGDDESDEGENDNAEDYGSDEESIQYHSDGRMVSSEIDSDDVATFLEIEARDRDGDNSSGDDSGDGWETTSSDAEHDRHNGRRQKWPDPYVDDYDSDLGTDYDDGAYDSADSWDNIISETPRGGYNMTLNMDQLKARLKFFHAKEQIDLPTPFPQFQKLPPELRMRIWETFCSELRRKNRVVQVMLQNDGRLTPAVTMDQQTEPVRRFMRICRETRAMGLVALPDTLHIGVSQHDDGVIRFNAETDIVHFLEEHPLGLERIGPNGEAGDVSGNNNGENNEDDDDVDGYGSDTGIHELMREMRRQRVRARKRRNEDIPKPYASVRNLAINDMERRLRAPGAYKDYYHGHTVIELIAQDDTSHRQPSELRGAGYLQTIEYLFPNLENIYVAEHGAVRKADRWAAQLRSYQRYHVNGYEVDDIELQREPIEYLYCWHEPPKGSRRRSLQGLEKKEEKAEGKAEGNKDKTAEGAKESAEDKLRKAEVASLGPQDFKDEVVINHFAKLREKGIRFSRMLFFDEEDGMGDYWELQALCRPDGHWPNDPDGNPRQDQQPSRDLEPPVDMGEFEDYDENDSMIDDDDLDEGDWEDDEGDDDEDEDGDDDDDDLHVVDDAAENGASAAPLQAMFSSPEPEDDAGPSRGNRSKRRRVVDSDDEEEDAAEEDKNGKEGSGRSRSPAKRQRRTAVVSSDEEDQDDDAGVGSSKMATTKAKTKKADNDDSSSHTEAGEEDEDEEDDEDDDDKPVKPLTLMQRLRGVRQPKPASDEENSDDDEEEEDAGDYGDDNEDEDEDDE